MYKVFDCYTYVIEDDSHEEADELIKKPLQLDELFNVHLTTGCVPFNTNKFFALISTHSHTPYIIDIESPPPNS